MGAQQLSRVGESMVWPLILGGLGVGALVARQGVRAYKRHGAQLKMPSFVTGAFKEASNRKLQGFEAPMTRAEAKLILNLREMNPAKDSIREAHRKLLVANHPDKGGS